MTPQEFKEAQLRLGLTDSELGAILNTDPSTIRRWKMPSDKKTARPPNPVAAKVLEWMLAGFRPPEFPVK